VNRSRDVRLRILRRRSAALFDARRRPWRLAQLLVLTMARSRPPFADLCDVLRVGEHRGFQVVLWWDFQGWRRHPAFAFCFAVPHARSH
jgi:hypothetical protein